MNTGNELGTGRRWSRSLRFRLTAWYTGVLAVILAGAAGLVYLGARHALCAETDGFLAGQAHRIAAIAVGRPGDPLVPADLDEGVAAPSRPPRVGRGEGLLFFDVVYTRLVKNPHGDTLAASPALIRQPALIASLDPLLRGRLPASGRFAFAGPDEERTMRVFTAPLRLGAGDGAIQVAVPWDHNADILERLGALLLLFVPSVLLLAALGGWVLIGQNLQPIGRIVTEAEHLDAAALPEALLPHAAETDTEIGQLVATLNRMTTRLRRAFEAQRRFAEAQQRFAADASHELRTPLTILRGEMELALSRPRPLENYQATLRSAMQEIARMTRIVEGLGFLARRDAGQMQGGFVPEDVDLAALCRRVADEFIPQAESKQIGLRCEAPLPVVARGSADQLQQLLINLVDNALKYTPPGGQVTVAVGQAGQEAELTVRDTGVGIAEADLPHVFDRFWRADKSRSSEGSGLGLAICAEIAAAHQGALYVTSVPGQGSCFRLELPAQTAAIGYTERNSS